MPLSSSNTTRTPGAGEDVKTFDDGSGAKIQGMVVVDSSGVPTTESNPLSVTARDSGGTEKATDANPNSVKLTSGGAEVGTAGAPLNTTLRNSVGTEIGTAADPVEVGLRNSAGTEIGTATDPVQVGLVNGAGTEIGTATDPLNFVQRDSADAEKAVDANPNSVKLTSGGAEVGTAGAPLSVVQRDSGGTEVGTAANPAVVTEGADPDLQAPYTSSALESKVENVATGPTTVKEVTFTASLATTTAKWIWIVDRTTMAGSTLADLVHAPVLVPEGGMGQASLFKKPRVCATALSVGVSSSPDTYVESGEGIFDILYT